MTWKPHDSSVPYDVMQSAADDTSDGRYEDALQKFLWFHEASRHQRGMAGVRLSFALGYWMDLASRYPPALDAFIALRDKMEERCLTNEGDYESFVDVNALNQYLNANKRTVDLFMQVARIAPRNAAGLYPIVERILVSEGQFHAAAPYLEWQKRIEMSINLYAMTWQEDAVHPPKFAKRHFQTEIASLVALLVLNDRTRDAVKVCDRCLDVLDDEEFRNCLRIALAGRFPTGEDRLSE